MGCLSSQPESQDSPSPAEPPAQNPVDKPAEEPANVPAVASPVQCEISNQACFGAGCYWGTEKYFTVEFCRRRFPEAMIKGQVGFMGPKGCKPNPTYKEVCTQETGYVEVYQFSYKGGEEMYRELVKFFFQFHDPSIPNAQGQDRGPSYASAIFVYDPVQRRIAEEVIAELKGYVADGIVTNYVEKNVTTAVLDSTEFFPAHDEHQEYLAKNPKGYCNHRIRLKEWPTRAAGAGADANAV